MVELIYRKGILYGNVDSLFCMLNFYCKWVDCLDGKFYLLFYVIVKKIKMILCYWF